MKFFYLFTFISMVCLCANPVLAEDLASNPWLNKISDNKSIPILKKVQKTSQAAADAILNETPANPWMARKTSTEDNLQNIKNNLVDTFETSAQNVRDLANQAQNLKQTAETVNQLQNIGNSDSQIPSNEQLALIAKNIRQLMPSKEGSGSDNHAYNSQNSMKFLQKIKSENASSNSSIQSSASRIADNYRKTTNNYKRKLQARYNSARRQIYSYTASARKAVQYLEKNSGIDAKSIQKMMK